MLIKYIASAVLGYLFGSISFAILITKYLMKNDVRTMGSGNAGATNVARVFGVGVGIATLIGDALKTVAAVKIGQLIGGENGSVFGAAFCIIGHSFPIFYDFKGGKGVTVGATVALLFDFRVFLIIAAVFFAVALTTKIVSLSSISAAVAFPIAMILFGGKSTTVIALSVFVGLSVILLHTPNIRRLIAGTEPKFKAKSAGSVKKDDYGKHS